MRMPRSHTAAATTSEGKLTTKYGDTWEYYDKDGKKEHLFDVGYDANRDETSQQFYDSLGSDFLDALDDFEDDD